MDKVLREISGKIFFVSGYESNTDSLDQDLFIFLFDNNGKVNEENDILYYNTKLKDFIYLPHGQVDKVPINSDKTIYGPFDEWTARNLYESLKLGKMYIDGGALLNLNDISGDIAEIVFAHVHYESLMEREYPQNWNSIKSLQNLIFRDSDHPTLLVKVKEDIDLRESPFFISSKLIRTHNNSWIYCPTFEKIVNMEKYMEDLLYKNEYLERFISAQDYNNTFDAALSEIRAGHKSGHWIWYVFPQLKGLGQSTVSHYYGLDDKEEALAFLHDKKLGYRLRLITSSLLSHKSMNVASIMGSKIDAIKLRSCMTLFDTLSPNDVFGQVLDVFFKGERDVLTLEQIT